MRCRYPRVRNELSTKQLLDKYCKTIVITLYTKTIFLSAGRDPIPAAFQVYVSRKLAKLCDRVETTTTDLFSTSTVETYC